MVNKIEVEYSETSSNFERGYLRGAYDKFPDFFRMGTFIDNTHMKL